jgi:hypothetical protein
MTTTVCLPAGITLKCFDLSSTRSLRGAVYGTPTAVMATTKVNVDAGFSGAGDIYTNIFFTVTAGASSPVITNQPVGVTNVAGGGVSFSVVAGGTAPLGYQWNFNATNLLANATNPLLSLAHVRASQAGNYAVVITNSSGSITSAPVPLVVTLPAPASIIPLSIAAANGVFQFSFTPVPGLTNTVLTNNNPITTNWGALTNIPPPANTNPATAIDTLGAGQNFYQVVVVP